MQLSKNIRILVVDDMRTMRVVVKRALEKIGFTNLDEASDGSIAIRMLDESASMNDPYKIVFCDWNMPNVQGIDVLKHVRSHPKLNAIPFFMVTAEREKEQIIEAIQSGVSDYIAKPFTPQTIAEKLAKFLQKAS